MFLCCCMLVLHVCVCMCVCVCCVISRVSSLPVGLTVKGGTRSVHEGIACVGSELRSVFESHTPAPACLPSDPPPVDSTSRQPRLCVVPSVIKTQILSYVKKIEKNNVFNHIQQAPPPKLEAHPPSSTLTHPPAPLPVWSVDN